MRDGSVSRRVLDLYPCTAVWRNSPFSLEVCMEFDARGWLRRGYMRLLRIVFPHELVRVSYRPVWSFVAPPRFLSEMSTPLLSSPRRCWC